MSLKSVKTVKSVKALKSAAKVKLLAPTTGKRPAKARVKTQKLIIKDAAFRDQTLTTGREAATATEIAEAVAFGQTISLKEFKQQLGW
jgi:hypothetical protein